MSKAPGDASSGSADPVATDALRRHVCRVLGVEVHAEGEKLVPSDGTGSITRLDWTRVDAVLGGADEKTSEGADDADAAAEGADDSASREETPRQPRGADDEDTVASVAEDADEDAVAASRGRVGPTRVEIDRTYAVGDVRVDAAGTSAQSRANFSSLRANACVFEGKWSYEATLGSSGIMQLGWCTTRCPFTRENGVGDAPDSFAFDGHRVRKWNVSSQPYGKAWVAGDVITCTIDLNPGPEGGTVSYHRNGVPLGVAFDNVRRWRDVEARRRRRRRRERFRVLPGGVAVHGRARRAQLRGRARTVPRGGVRASAGSAGRGHGPDARGTGLARVRGAGRASGVSGGAFG